MTSVQFSPPLARRDWNEQSAKQKQCESTNQYAPPAASFSKGQNTVNYKNFSSV